MRAEVVAANMANAETTRTAEGGPYRRQEVVFAAGRGDQGFLDSMTAATNGGCGDRGAQRDCRRGFRSRVLARWRRACTSPRWSRILRRR